MRYTITYHGSRPDEVVEADTFKDRGGAGGTAWIDFVRFVDDGHADLVEQRVFRVSAGLVQSVRADEAGHVQSMRTHEP